MKFNNILLKIVKTLLYSVPLIMLYVDSNLLYPYISGKSYLFRALVEIVLIFYLLLIARNSNYLPNLKNPLVISITAFMAILTIATFTGVDWQRSFFGTIERSEGLFHLMHYYIYFLLLIAVFKKRKDWYVILGVYVFSVLAMTIYSWCNGFWARDLSDVNNTIYGTAGHKIYYGVSLLFSLFFTFYFLLFRKNIISNKSKIFNVFYIFINIFCIASFFISLLMSKARGPMLGLVAGILFSTILFILFGSKKYKYYKIIIIAIILFAIISSTIIYIFKDGPLLYDKGIVHRYFGLSIYDKTLQARFWTWGSAWEGIKEKPILGWGIENFNVVFDKYFDVRHYFGPGSETWFDRPHNILIEMWVTTGIVGLISYLFIFCEAFYQLIKRNYKKNKYICFWGVGFLVAHLIQNLFSFDTIYSYLGFFIFLGLIYQISLSADKNYLVHRSNKSYILPVSALCIGLLLLLNYRANYKPFIGNALLLKEINLINQNKISEASRLFDENIKINSNFIITDIKTLTANALAQNNNNYNYDYIEFSKIVASELEKDIYKHSKDNREVIPLAKLYRIMGEELESKEYFMQSEYFFQRALRLNQYRPEAIFGLARTYMVQKKYNKAIIIVNSYLEKRPEDNYSHFMLGSVYKEMGEETRARREFEKSGMQFEK